MGHDAAALHVAEAVNKGAEGPLHHRSGGEGQEPQGGAHHLASARVARGAALDADRDPDYSECHN